MEFVSEKMIQKYQGKKKVVEMRRQMIGVSAQFEVHTIQFSLHMQSGSSQRSLGDSTKFFSSFEWCEKASASRQEQRMKTLIFEKERKLFFLHTKKFQHKIPKRTQKLFSFFW